jgi:hypothetical protein
MVTHRAMMLVHKTVSHVSRIPHSDSGVKNGKGPGCGTQLLKGGCHLGIRVAHGGLAVATGGHKEQEGALQPEAR